MNVTANNVAYIYKTAQQSCTYYHVIRQFLGACLYTVSIFDNLSKSSLLYLHINRIHLIPMQIEKILKRKLLYM